MILADRRCGFRDQASLAGDRMRQLPDHHGTGLEYEAARLLGLPWMTYVPYGAVATGGGASWGWRDLLHVAEPRLLRSPTPPARQWTARFVLRLVDARRDRPHPHRGSGEGPH
jgi:hypothetical protein